MALLDNVFKQRMIGALVLIALAVIFLPMLFTREDELHQVRVEAPQAPQAPVVPDVKVEPVPVPEAQALAEEPLPEQVPPVTATATTAPTTPIKPIPAPPSASKPATTPAKAAPATPQPVASAPAKPDSAAKIDPNGLPVSWSIQLASLANRTGADNLQKALRAQGYNAYVRSADGKNRVFVGPLVERAEAERVRDIINRQQNLKGFVVRFEPERG
jgi:DedD protein